MRDPTAWNGLAEFPRAGFVSAVNSSPVYALLSLFLLVLFVSFMFRVLGLLKRIAEGVDALRAQPPSLHANSSDEPLHPDPDIAALIARKRQSQSDSLRHHFR
jgi:hypothetical protein